jgi:hypothetical protein
MASNSFLLMQRSPGHPSLNQITGNDLNELVAVCFKRALLSQYSLRETEGTPEKTSVRTAEFSNRLTLH